MKMKEHVEYSYAQFKLGMAIFFYMDRQKYILPYGILNSDITRIIV